MEPSVRLALLGLAGLLVLLALRVPSVRRELSARQELRDQLAPLAPLALPALPDQPAQLDLLVRRAPLVPQVQLEIPGPRGQLAQKEIPDRLDQRDSLAQQAAQGLPAWRVQQDQRDRLGLPDSLAPLDLPAHRETLAQQVQAVLPDLQGLQALQEWQERREARDQRGPTGIRGQQDPQGPLGPLEAQDQLECKVLQGPQDLSDCQALQDRQGRRVQ